MNSRGLVLGVLLTATKLPEIFCERLEILFRFFSIAFFSSSLPPVSSEIFLSESCNLNFISWALLSKALRKLVGLSLSGEDIESK